jgi:hypothetical protein
MVRRPSGRSPPNLGGVSDRPSAPPNSRRAGCSGPALTCGCWSRRPDLDPRPSRTHATILLKAGVPGGGRQRTPRPQQPRVHHDRLPARPPRHAGRCRQALQRGGVGEVENPPRPRRQEGSEMAVPSCATTTTGTGREVEHVLWYEASDVVRHEIRPPRVGCNQERDVLPLERKMRGPPVPRTRRSRSCSHFDGRSRCQSNGLPSELTAAVPDLPEKCTTDRRCPDSGTYRSSLVCTGRFCSPVLTQVGKRPLPAEAWWRA